MNRGVEIDGDIADDINRSVIQEQVEMGVAVRMAAMDLLARNLRVDAKRCHGMSLTMDITATEHGIVRLFAIETAQSL